MLQAAARTVRVSEVGVHVNNAARTLIATPTCLSLQKASDLFLLPLSVDPADQVDPDHLPFESSSPKHSSSRRRWRSDCTSRVALQKR